MPFVIDKIKQKNGLGFKILDAVDVEMPDGKGLDEAIDEIKENAGGKLVGTTEDITPTEVANAVKENKNCFITHTDATYGKMILSGFAYNEGMNIVIASAYLSVDFGTFGITLLGFVSNDEWVFYLDTLAKGSDLPKRVTAVNLTEFETSGIIEETYEDASTNTYNFEFDSEGNPTKITDSDGNETVLTW